MIEKVKDYISTYSGLDDFVKGNVDYLVDKVNAYSINEQVGYNPIVNTYTDGNKEMQFLFNFDVKFHWNDELKNNINNSIFFESFRDWLETNDYNSIYPELEDNIIPISIRATSNGYIYTTGSNEAIYRISCEFKYEKMKGEI